MTIKKVDWANVSDTYSVTIETLPIEGSLFTRMTATKAGITWDVFAEGMRVHGGHSTWSSDYSSIIPEEDQDKLVDFPAGVMGFVLGSIFSCYLELGIEKGTSDLSDCCITVTRSDDGNKLHAVGSTGTVLFTCGYYPINQDTVAISQ